jgi:hypothetical protein
MNISEQIAIMKHETRLANRTAGDGLKNWTPEARAASLATRRARGSVWGWDKRKRAGIIDTTTEAFDSSMEALEQDAEKVRATLASHRAGVPTIGPRNAYADQLAAQRLESFKAWLAEVKRVEGAIDDFNGVVAALGGLTGGMAKAQRGQRIGPVKQDAAAEAAARKTSVEKSIRRNFEKRNADHLRKYPEERPVMLDMVAEKAEYYSAQPARKVEMEKEAYRRIRDEGISSMREVSDYAAEFKTALEAKRTYVRERDAVKPQLHIDEVAYPIGNGRWVAQRPDGSERVIDTSPAPVVLKLKTPAPAPKKTGKLKDDNDWADMLQDSRYLIGGRYFDHVANRWTPAARKASLAVRKARGSVWGWNKRKRYAPGTDSATNGTDEAGKDEKRSVVSEEAIKQLEDAIQEEKAGYWDVLTEKIENAIASYKENGVDGMSESEKKRLADVLSESGELSENLKELLKELQGGAKKEGKEDGESAPLLPEDGEHEEKLLTYYKKAIELGDPPDVAAMKADLGADSEKFKKLYGIVAEAWHTHSLDKFQDMFGRDPKRNFEFRMFQKKIGVPPEFIGGK